MYWNCAIHFLTARTLKPPKIKKDFMYISYMVSLTSCNTEVEDWLFFFQGESLLWCQTGKAPEDFCSLTRRRRVHFFSNQSISGQSLYCWCKIEQHGHQGRVCHFGSRIYNGQVWRSPLPWICQSGWWKAWILWIQGVQQSCPSVKSFVMTSP